MQSLTKEAEQKLIAAIEQAAGFVNSGLTPNDAIIKSASAANIPAGHINLMVHAYNTGRTTTQREQGDNTLEKAADFQLADAQTVLDALYPKTVKTSAEIVRQQVVSTDYAVSPAGMLARRRAEQEKAAAAQVALPAKTWTPPPRDEQYAVERAYSDKRAAKLAQEELRRQTTAAYVKAAESMDKIAEYFRTPGNMSYADALQQVELRFGNEGVSVLKKVAAVYPAFEKQSATKIQHFGHDRLYGLVEDVVTKVAEYVSAFGAYSPKKADAVSKKTAQEFLTGSVLQEVPDFSAGIVLKQAWSPDKNPANPGPGPGLPAAIAGMFTKDRDAAAAQKEEDDFQAQLAANRAEAASRNNSILRQQMLDEAAAFESDEKAQRLEAANQQLGDMTLSQFGHSLFPMLPHTTPRDMTMADPFAGIGGKLTGAGGAVASGLGALRKGWNDATPKNNVGVADMLKSIAAPAQVVGKNMGMSIGTMLGNDKKPDDVKRKQFAALSNPEHEAELRSIRAKSVLHDLVLNDPVISGHDPAEVAAAFNELAEVSPNLVDSPGILRAVMRKRLESGQLADFDLKQLLEMDKLRLERDKSLADTKKTEQELI